MASERLQFSVPKSSAVAMYERIMIPVDLRHPDAMEKAIGVGAALARQFEAAAHLVAVTSVPPNEIARTSAEYRDKVERFTDEHAEALDIEFQPHVIESQDLTIDLDRHLREAAEEIDADLIVMASHVPHFGEWLTHSHARWLVSHTARSLFIVR